MTRPPGPFDIPEFSFRYEVVSGAAPLRVRFWPMTRSGVGEFYWDPEGAGKPVDSSKMGFYWVYETPGEYTPSAKAHFEDGRVIEYTGRPITVTEADNTIEAGNMPSPDLNVDWDKSARLGEGQVFYGCCMGTSFFHFTPTDYGEYRFKVSPVAATTGGGIDVAVLTEGSHYLLGASGGGGNYGDITIRLGRGERHFIRLTGSGYYKLSAEKIDGDK